MNDKIKQKQNNAAIMLALFFFGIAGMMFSVPTHAYEDTSINDMDFSNQPLVVYTPNTCNDLIANGDVVAIRPTNLSVYGSSSVDDTFFCGYQHGSGYQFFAVSNTNGAFYWCGSWQAGGSNYSTDYIGLFNSEYQLYFSSPSNYNFESNTTINVPIFSTQNDALAAVRDWIDNPPPPPSTDHRFADSLAPGHVAVFDIGGLSDINIVLGTTLFSGYKYSGYSTTQAAGMTSTMPTSISLPLSYTSSISWQGSGQKNLIGQYSNFAFTEHVNSTFSSQYYVVVNPLSGSAPANSTLEASPSNRNNNITILIDKVKSYKTFSLTESFEIDSNGWSEDTSSNGSTTTGTFDDDTGSWIGTNDQTGQPENFNDLPVGGGNTPLVGGNNSINDWLQDIANTIKGFFSGAIGAVTTLVSSGSAFINQLAGLYSWLPPAVYSVLVSALVIVITIGVIKVFI